MTKSTTSDRALAALDTLREQSRTNLDAWFRQSRRRLEEPGILDGGPEITVPPVVLYWYLLGYDSLFIEQWRAALRGGSPD